MFTGVLYECFQCLLVYCTSARKVDCYELNDMTSNDCVHTTTVFTRQNDVLKQAALFGSIFLENMYTSCMLIVSGFDILFIILV